MTTPQTDTTALLFRIHWHDGPYSGVAIVSADNANDAKQQVRVKKPRAQISYPQTFRLARGILTLG